MNQTDLIREYIYDKLLEIKSIEKESQSGYNEGFESALREILEQLDL